MPLKRTFSVSESNGSGRSVKAKTSMSKRNRVSRVTRGSVVSRGPELKYTQVNISQTQSAGSDIIFLNGIGTGTDNSQRIGRRIALVNVRVKGFIESDQTLLSSTCGTVALVYDRNPQTVMPGLADIFDMGSAMGNTAVPNPDNADRFTILKEVDYSCLGNNGTALNYVGGVATGGIVGGSPTANSFCTFDLFAKLRGVEANFVGTTAGISSLDQGGLFLVITNNLGGSHNFVGMRTQVRFTDM